MRGLFVRCEFERIRRRPVRRQQALNLGRIQPAVGPNLLNAVTLKGSA